MAERSEEVLNPLLRRADWRFLLGQPHPGRVYCLATGPLADAVAAIAGEVVTGGSAVGCDLAVAEDPAPAVLADLFAALRPGGACYVEWRGDDRRPIEQALHAAGFAEVELYRPWPPFAALPAYWVPVNAPGAAGYLRSRRRLRGGRLRRLLADIRGRAGGLLRRRPRGLLCAVARRPSEPAGPEAGLATWLRQGWTEWGLDVPPSRLSTLLVTGGPRSVSKAVLLAFAEPSPVPLVAIKAPRVNEAAAGVRREGAVLAALTAEGAAPPGVPRLLFRREVDGVPFVGERALSGRPLESLLGRRNARSWSLKVADWLAALAGRGQPRPAAEWMDVLVEPLLARFEEQFGALVDRGLLREGAAVARALGDCAAVPEQRDFGPWNLLAMPEGELGVLDWESGEVEGLPALDLLYYLAYASFHVDRAHDRDSRLASYRRSLDPATPSGALRRECLARYVSTIGLDPARLAPLRVLLWLVHAPSDFRHAAADAGGVPAARALERSLFVALWAEEVRGTVG